jgi:hypothetical protein
MTKAHQVERMIGQGGGHLLSPATAGWDIALPVPGAHESVSKLFQAIEERLAQR